MRRRPQHSDEDLLDAATKVFADSGFDSATLNDIAEESGSTKPTLYARFGNKDSLYSAALEREAKTLAERLLGAYERAEGRPLTELVQIAVQAWFEYAEDNQDGFRLLFMVAESGPGGERVEALKRLVTDRVVDLVRTEAPATERVDEPTIRMLGAMIVGACIEGARRARQEGLEARRATAVAVGFMFGAYLRTAAESESTPAG